jgi:hypothetical protein
MKNIFTLSLFIFFSYASPAQPLVGFPQPGMSQVEIYHGDWTINGYPSNSSFYYSGDTVVNGLSFAVMTTSNFNTGNFYTYYNGGKIYAGNGNIFLSNPLAYSSWRLYDFSLNVGDTITLGTYLNNGLFTVSLVTPMLLQNGQTRKYMELTQGSRTIKWLDGVGDIQYGFFYNADFEGGYEDFICHSDSSGMVYSDVTFNLICDPVNPVVTIGTATCGSFTFNFSSASDCGSCSGSVNISNISGGTGPYSLSWSHTADTSSVQPSVCGGAYQIIITDALSNSCSALLYVLSGPTANVQLSNYDCINGNSTICIVTYYGMPPFAYQWSTGSSTRCVNNLPPGSYPVTITDAAGCQQTINAIVPVTSPLVAYATITNANCQSCCDGNVLLNFYNGTPPYAITSPVTWPSPGTFCTGVYPYTVTDFFGCAYSDTATVGFTTGVFEINDQDISLFPQPANDKITVQLKGNVITKLKIFDLMSRTLLQLEIEKISSKEINLADLIPGFYIIEIETSNKQSVRTQFVISR